MSDKAVSSKTRPLAMPPAAAAMPSATALALAATAFGLGWLVLVLGALLWQGFSGLSLAVFTEMTPPPGSSGGLLNPIVGAWSSPFSRS